MLIRRKPFRHPSRSAFQLLERLEPRQLFSAGALDPSFGTGGVKTLPLTDPYAGGTYLPTSVDVVNGKTVVVGQINSYADQEKSFIARLNGDGSMDTTFGGGDGIVTTTVINNSASDVVV